MRNGVAQAKAAAGARMTLKTGQAQVDRPLSGSLLKGPAGSVAETRNMADVGAVSEQRSAAIRLHRVYALPGIAIGLVYLAAYVLLDRVSLVHASTPLGITPWNPGAGLGLVMVLLFGRRTIPYLFPAPLLADLVNLQTLLPWSAELLGAAVIGAGYAAASLLLLRPNVRFDPALSSLRDLVILIIAAVISAAIVACGYVGAMIAAGVLPLKEIGAAILRYWVGDLIGIVVITPFALIALTRPRAFRPSIETALQVAAIITALVLVFGISQEERLFYVLFLPIIWMALRAGFEGVSLGVLITQLGLIVGVELFRGESHDLMAFQVLMLILAVTGLLAGELVSERRRVESQLRLHRDALGRLSRLGNAGELAAAIAHEINQPLAAAGTYTRLVKDALQEGDSDPAMVVETAEKAAAQVERAAEVVRRLRALVRLDRSARAACSVERIVKETIALCQPNLDRGQIAMRCSLPANLPLVMVDMLQIEQTLLNLMRNSIDAITEAQQADGTISIAAVYDEGDSIEIQVADNGPGFPPGFLDNPFLPFSSEKAQGLGVGLPLCRSIVEAHGGRLWLTRNVTGALVHFTIPVAQEMEHG
jgi:two-component system, LuxR family, sensor kinase FixL